MGAIVGSGGCACISKQPRCQLTHGATQLHQLLVISLCCLARLVEVAHEDLAVVVANLCAPAVVLAVPEDTPACVCVCVGG